MAKSPSEIVNVDDYSREKIQYTISDLERAADALRRYVAFADQCAAQGVKLAPHSEFGSLRYSERPADPHGGISRIEVMAQSALADAETIMRQEGKPVDRRVIEDQLAKDKIKKMAISRESLEEILKNKER